MEDTGRVHKSSELEGQNMQTPFLLLRPRIYQRVVEDKDKRERHAQDTLAGDEERHGS